MTKCFEKNPTHLLAGKKTKPQESFKIVNPLLQVLHGITEDEKFKFHNLRHSKASWDMLSIINAQFNLELETQFFSHSPRTQLFLQTAKERWAQAVHTPESYHKAPYYLHKAMGHSNLLTTLKHYIHFMDISVAGLLRRRAKEIMTIVWASNLSVRSKSSLYEKSKNEDMIQVILESVYPWSNILPTKTRSKEFSSEPDESVKNSSLSSLEKKSLTPLNELNKLKPFCFFQLYAQRDNEQQAVYAKLLRLDKEELSAISKHFEMNPAYRFKEINTSQGNSNLLNLITGLPQELQTALLDDSLWIDENYSDFRDQVSQFIERMTTKMESAKDSLSSIREFDVIFHQFKEAKPVLTLCNALDLQCSFKFSPPKSGKVTIEDWAQSLELSEEQLINTAVTGSRINNTNGRLTLRIQRINQTKSKNLEVYLLLSILDSYCKWRQLKSQQTSRTA